MTPEKALAEAARIMGGKTKLARALNVTPQALSQWTICPPKYVLKVEDAVRKAVKLLKHPVNKHDLRPDLYPRGRR